MGLEETRKDLRAAVAARQELGREYEDEIIDSFLEKLDARMAAQGLEPAPAAAPKPAPPAYELQREKDPGGLALAIVSVVAAIPITAIAANLEGTFAVVLSWGGLVAINLARSVGRLAGRR